MCWNNAIANSDDWPEAALLSFWRNWRAWREDTSASIDRESWKETCRLVQITADITPWYLREGGMKGQELGGERGKVLSELFLGSHSLRWKRLENDGRMRESWGRNEADAVSIKRVQVASRSSTRRRRSMASTSEAAVFPLTS